MRPLNVADAVRSLRQTMGLTQEKMARALHLTTVTIARYEQERSPASSRRLLDFAYMAADLNRADLAKAFIHAFALRTRIHLTSCDLVAVRRRPPAA